MMSSITRETALSSNNLDLSWETPVTSGQGAATSIVHKQPRRALHYIGIYRQESAEACCYDCWSHIRVRSAKILHQH